MRRVAPFASKRDTLLHCGSNVKGDTFLAEAERAKKRRLHLAPIYLCLPSSI
jgi:hypothetical protein